MRPLGACAFPAGDVAMMLTIALRFIPTTAEEAEKIIVAQTARGARFDEGGPDQRARGLRSGARAAVRQPVPARRRPCGGDGVTMLPWRRGQDAARRAAMRAADWAALGRASRSCDREWGCRALGPACQEAT